MIFPDLYASLCVPDWSPLKGDGSLCVSREIRPALPKKIRFTLFLDAFKALLWCDAIFYQVSQVDWLVRKFLESGDRVLPHGRPAGLRRKFKP